MLCSSDRHRGTSYAKLSGVTPAFGGEGEGQGQEFQANLDHLDFEAPWLCVSPFQKTKTKKNSFGLEIQLYDPDLWVPILQLWETRPGEATSSGFLNLSMKKVGCGGTCLLSNNLGEFQAGLGYTARPYHQNNT